MKMNNELKLFESYGNISQGYVIMNSDEYAYISGSSVVVKQIINKDENSIKVLE
jgi:hypothetical protein